MSSFERCERLFFSGLELERLHALIGFGVARDSRATPLLTRVVSSPAESTQAKILAIRSLGEIGDIRAVPHLTLAAHEGPRSLRAVAVDALKKLERVNHLSPRLSSKPVQDFNGRKENGNGKSNGRKAKSSRKRQS